MELPQAPGTDDGDQHPGFSDAPSSSRHRGLVLPPPPASRGSLRTGSGAPPQSQQQATTPRCLGTILIEPNPKVYPSQLPRSSGSTLTPKKKSLFASWFGEQTPSDTGGGRDSGSVRESSCLARGLRPREHGRVCRRDSFTSPNPPAEASAHRTSPGPSPGPRSRRPSSWSLPWTSRPPPFPASVQSGQSFFSALPPEAVARARTPPPSRLRDPAVFQQKPRTCSFTQSARADSRIPQDAIGFAAHTAAPPPGRRQVVVVPLSDNGAPRGFPPRRKSPECYPSGLGIRERSSTTGSFVEGVGAWEREPPAGFEGTGARARGSGIGIPMTRSFPSPSIRVYGGVESVLGPDDPVPSPRLRSAPLPHEACDPRPPVVRQYASSRGGFQGSSGNHAPAGHTLVSTPPVTEVPGYTEGRSMQGNRKMADYSRAQTTQKVLEQRMVSEGYDRFECIVPRLRPVSVVEKRVEVPVVKTVDTIVPRPRVEERIKFVDKPIFQEVEKFVEVPEVFFNDVIVEVPEIIEVIKRVPREEIHENITYVPKFETKIVPKYVEVPIIKVVDRYEEVQEVHEVLKPVPKVTVVDVPREVMRIVPSYVVHKTKKEVRVPVVEYKEVPRYRTKYEPKIVHNVTVNHIPEYHDIEVPYEVPRVTVVEQRYFVTKYRDHHYPVTVSQSVTPMLRPGAHTQVVDVPVQQPYIVAQASSRPGHPSAGWSRTNRPSAVRPRGANT